MTLWSREIRQPWAKIQLHGAIFRLVMMHQFHEIRVDFLEPQTPLQTPLFVRMRSYYV